MDFTSRLVWQGICFTANIDTSFFLPADLPSCGAVSNTNETSRVLTVEEGEYVNLACTVSYDVYSDDWPPQLQWSQNRSVSVTSQNRPTQLYTTVTVPSEEDYQTARSNTSIEMKDVDDGSIFTCRIFFDNPPDGFFNMMNPSYDNQFDGEPPEFDHYCDINISVSCEYNLILSLKC